jgi:hypothetical protein
LIGNRADGWPYLAALIVGVICQFQHDQQMVLRWPSNVPDHRHKADAHGANPVDDALRRTHFLGRFFNVKP